MSRLETVRTVPGLRARLDTWRGQGDSIALVPTMGALHAGHLALVERGLALAERCVVTLFVNPKQFGPNEDFAVYPRDEQTDARLLEEAGAHLLYAPTVDSMYAEGHATKVSLSGVGEVLEGNFRPGFFDGVATVVAKLLIQALPTVALFGEKDYQQLQVIKRLVQDLDIPTEIIGVPTVREPDGLALSSRNAYLTPTERQAAPTLQQTLLEVARRFQAGDSPADLEAWGMDQLQKVGFGTVDYISLRDAATLEPVSAPGDRPARVLAAAWLGKARLIDNVAA
ncbi:MAG: pantoate--beta-alanine ligase [Magnetospiraceae bacterium]